MRTLDPERFGMKAIERAVADADWLTSGTIDDASRTTRRVVWLCLVTKAKRVEPYLSTHTREHDTLSV